MGVAPTATFCAPDDQDHAVLAAIPPPPFTGFELGPLDLRMYGLLIAIGALLAFQLVVTRYERTGGDPELAERAAMLALVGGLLGARIGYVIPRYDHFLSNPADILAIWQGGLAFFGGLTGGTLAVIVYVRLRGGDIPAIADAVAPALPLAQAVGRWGNYFNQELFGRPSDLPWALRLDPGILERYGYPAGTTVHPTFLYESVWNLGLVGVILLIDRRGWLRRRGSLMFIYLIGYGIGRGWIETLRVDTEWRLLGLSRNNWIALLVVLIGVGGLLWWERRGTGTLLRDADQRTDTSSADDDTPAATGTTAATGTHAASDDATTSSDDATTSSDAVTGSDDAEQTADADEDR